MWMWSSTKPRTRAVGRGPLKGWPVTFTSTSGKFAQPWADVNAQRGLVAAIWRSRPAPVTPTCRPVDTFVNSKLPPLSATLQSAAGPGVALGEMAPSTPALGMRASGA